MAVQEGRVEQPGSARPNRWPTVLVLVVALAARLLYWRFAIPGYEPISDDAQYLEIASNIANGDGFSTVFPQLELHATAFRPPLYPYLLGGLFVMVGGPSVAWAQALNLAVGLGVVYLVMRLGRHVGGRRVGIVAGLLVALLPTIIANDVVLLSEPLSLLILVGCLLALLNERWLVAGLLGGALVLARPSAQFLVLALVLWVWFSRRSRRTGPPSAADDRTAADDRGRRPVLRPILLLIAGAALVVGPWIVRNQVALGSPTLVTSNGFNLAAMYSPQATEAGRFVDPVRDERFDSFRFSQLDEVGWQRDLQDLAWQHVRANPGVVPRIIFRNLRAHFEIRPEVNERAEHLDGRNLTVRAWTLPLFYVTLGLGVIGLYLLRRTAAGQLLIIVAAYFVASSLVVIAVPRVRAPVDLILCLGSAVTLVHLWSRWSPRAGPAAPDATESATATIDLERQPVPAPTPIAAPGTTPRD